jgi:hypothetical protein
MVLNGFDVAKNSVRVEPYGKCVPVADFMRFAEDYRGLCQAGGRVYVVFLRKLFAAPQEIQIFTRMICRHGQA